MNLIRLRNTILSLGAIFLTSCSLHLKDPADIEANDVVPTKALITYQEMETIGFIHFSINTFTNKEWGYGDEDPELFNPVELNTDQWVEAAKAGGLKQLILTAKHHDGFCLWPSKYTEHSLKNSPYKDGSGDIVREFTESCRKYGIKAGLYLSPWDRNHKDYGSEAYIEYYKSQLRELLTNYGEINEIWFDGANGGDGFYGGAREIRKIDPETYYGWSDIFSIVKELQPGIKIFSDAGPDVHWIGNEKGFAGETFWSTINSDTLIIGKSDTEYLNRGDPNGKKWIVGQCDVSIRPGWFYHEAEDKKVKSPQELIDIYYNSVGRNSILLINIPPDQKGLFHEKDIATLKIFREILDETFATDLAVGATVRANNHRLSNEKFAPENVLDNNIESYWATDDTIFPSWIELEFSSETLFDRIMLREPVVFGQRVSEFTVEIMDQGKWVTVFEGTTIGYKRLLRINPVKTGKVRINILSANNTAAISKIGLFESSEKEKKEPPNE